MDMSPVEASVVAKDLSPNLMTFYHPHHAEGNSTILGKTSFDSRFKIEMPTNKKQTSMSPEFRQRDSL
jgi:hypothetical protein